MVLKKLKVTGELKIECKIEIYMFNKSCVSSQAVLSNWVSISIIFISILNVGSMSLDIFGHSKWSTTHRVLKSHKKEDKRNIYVIMKTMCPPGYHHNGFVATHALGHMMYGLITV